MTSAAGARGLCVALSTYKLLMPRKRKKRKRETSILPRCATVVPRVHVSEHAARVKTRWASVFLRAGRVLTLGQVRTQNRIASVNDASPSLVARNTLIRFAVRKRSEMNRLTDRSRWSRNYLEQKSSRTPSFLAMTHLSRLALTELDKTRRKRQTWTIRGTTAPWVNLVLSALRERRLIRSL